MSWGDILGGSKTSEKFTLYHDRAFGPYVWYNQVILKNGIENGICTSSSTKGYMHSFKGFADVVSKIKKKMTKKISLISEDNWAVDVDHNGTPIFEQIEEKIVSVIGRINGPV